MKYDQCKQIVTSQASVWLIKYKEDESEWLAIWHKDAKIEDIINSKLVMGKKRFTVQRIDNGEFQINPVEGHFYSGDARKVDWRFNMKL
jgi:hypothetical protein